MIRKNRLSILIPDGENHILILIVNCLALQRNLKVFVMSSKKTCHMRYSRFVDGYIYYPKSNVLDWINNIDFEVEKNDIDIILPIYEIAIEKLIRKGHLLRNRDKLCYLPGLESFNSARNKGELYKYLEANNFARPISLLTKKNTISNLEALDFPVIAKPVEGFGGGMGIEVLNTEKELFEYFEKTTFNYDFIIQNYIEGYDVCSNVLCKNGEILAYSCQKGVAFEYGPNSAQIAFEFIDVDKVYELTHDLMKSLSWSGPANIDFRYDLKEKEFKVIEINTRFWGNINASALAGVNFPYLHCLSSLNIDFEEQKVELMSYLNLKGVARKLAKRPYLIFNLKYLLNNTSVKFVFMDPLPFVYKFFDRTFNIMFSRGEKRI